MNRLVQGLLGKGKSILRVPYRYLKISAFKIRKASIQRKKRQRAENTVTIGFIVQMPEIWDKEAPLFEALANDARFELVLIIVPHYDFSKQEWTRYGEEKAFFTQKYPDAKIVLLETDNDMVVDDSYDYIFYQRCWEHYLPEQLRCKNVIKHAMTCYIPYCYYDAAEPDSYFENNFFWNLSKFYCCSEDQLKQVKQIGNIECQYMGYPVMEAIEYTDRLQDEKNILWTPRWSDDPAQGGTSFKKFKDRILELLEISKNVNLTLRPHPLTFENAVKEKWMTQSEVEKYKLHVVNSGARLDDNKMIEETFLTTDILITDFSSAIINFLLSGRPIIYCTGKDFAMTDTFRDVIDSLYLAKDWEEVLKYVRELIAGNDPLYDKRREVISRISGNESSVERIMEDLYQGVFESCDV